MPKKRILRSPKVRAHHGVPLRNRYDAEEANLAIACSIRGSCELEPLILANERKA